MSLRGGNRPFGVSRVSLRGGAYPVKVYIIGGTLLGDGSGGGGGIFTLSLSTVVVSGGSGSISSDIWMAGGYLNIQ